MTKTAVKISPEKHLAKADKVLAKIISQVVLKERKAHKRYFEALCVSIISQQLSTKAADTIEKRFRSLFSASKGRPERSLKAKSKFPEPAQILAKSDKSLRTAGLSFQKISYIKSLAKLVNKGEINFKKFAKLSDEQIIETLVQVKGIGRWTAEMFLMFCLNRPDVFSAGDLGLKNAVKKWYKLDGKLHPKKFLALTETWRPHRTAAARYLWASLNLGK
jgi:DNA-3-methyladenine glycosylase II